MYSTLKTTLLQVFMNCKSTYILMLETGQYLNFPKRPLAICLMFEW